MDIDKKNTRKEIPQMVINGLLFIVNGFVLAMIICLFLFQSREKASVKATIHDFKENVQHIKISSGRDYDDCTINEGIFVGNARQSQEASVIVEEIEDD